MCNGLQAYDETLCVQCKECARDSPNQYNSIYKSCNGSDRQDVVVCAMNPSSQAMVGDACPEGHFAVGMLSAIDAPLRQSFSAGAAVQFMGIVPFVSPMYPSVKLGDNVLVSVSVTFNSTTTFYTRLIEFAVSLFLCLTVMHVIKLTLCKQGEIHLGTVRKDTEDVLSSKPRTPYPAVVPPDMLLNQDMPRLQRSMFMDPSASYLYAVTRTVGSADPKSLHRLSLASSSGAVWEQVFSAASGSLGNNVAQIIACNSILLQGNAPKAFCAYTRTTGFMQFFELNLLHGSYANLGNAAWNVTSSRVRFSTEIVFVPASSSNGDFIIGAPLPEDPLVYGTILIMWGSNASLTPLPDARGIGVFKSMAFSEDGLSLFAVDEQPGLWRWKRSHAQSQHWNLFSVAR